ncbi:hypothetical protein, partial [Rahnella aceris]
MPTAFTLPRRLGFFRYSRKIPKTTDHHFGIYYRRLLLPTSVSLFFTIRITVLSDTPHNLAV